MILSFKSSQEVALDLALRLKHKRKWLKHSRDKSAELTGVPAPTIRRFEDKGEISLRQLLMLIQVYDEFSSVDKIFALPKAKTMDELIERNQQGTLR